MKANTHMHAHVCGIYTREQMDSQKKKENTSDSPMKPAASARVTRLTLLQGFKSNNQYVAKRKKKKGKFRESSRHIQGDFALEA